MRKKFYRAVASLVTLAAGILATAEPAAAWRCEAWSNQKQGWARGWGRSPSLDRAKRLALGNCFIRSRGKKVRCSITSCTR